MSTALADPRVDVFARHHAAALTAMAEAGGGSAQRFDDVVAFDLRRPAGFYNGAVLLGPPSDLGTTLDRIEAFAAGGSGTFELWAPFELPDLSLRGWRPAGAPIQLQRAPAPVLERVPAGLTVVEARTADTLADWEHVAIVGFPFEGVADRRGALAGEALLDDRRYRCFVGYEGDRPVTIGTLFESHGLAGLSLGVTLPDARRKGYWDAMVRTRLRAAEEPVAAGVFSDMSAPGAQHTFDFTPVTRWSIWAIDRTNDERTTT